MEPETGGALIDLSGAPKCKHGTPEPILCGECCLEWLGSLTPEDKRALERNAVSASGDSGKP